MKTVITACLALLLSMLWSLPAAFAQTISGCLSSADGRLYNFVFGAKTVNCRSQDAPVILGAQGTEGETGPEGPAGPAGSPAGQFQLRTVGTLTNGNISNAEWNQCAIALGGRPANTRDVITLPWDPASPNFDGWVSSPHIVATGDENFSSVVDISGIISTLGNMTCRGSDATQTSPWVSMQGTRTGLAANRNSVNLEQCSLQNFIVCVVPNT